RARTKSVNAGPVLCALYLSPQPSGPEWPLKAPQHAPQGIRPRFGPLLVSGRPNRGSVADRSDRRAGYSPNMPPERTEERKRAALRPATVPAGMRLERVPLTPISVDYQRLEMALA